MMCLALDTLISLDCRSFWAIEDEKRSDGMLREKRAALEDDFEFRILADIAVPIMKCI